ncbi:MAG: acyl-CoA/acyl-ACP dehydrogenase [Deltaproteobacteria bacterium]|nr:acyl-CoA/acyl-ACP dehydrogenase [Deltaproteobacteria bacterium]
MNLDFSSEQTMLRDSAAKFFANECNYEKVKHLEESEKGYSPELWQKVAELGWTGLLFPESYGGYGGSFLDLVIILEEMGKACFPSPFFSTIVQCGLLILEGGTEEQKQDLLSRIADGSLIMSLAQYEAETDFSYESITMKAEAKGDGYVLNGTKLFAMDANIASKLIVAAQVGAAGLSLFLVDADHPGVSIKKLPYVSSENACEVVFKDVVIGKNDLIGAPGAGATLLDKMYDKAAVAKAAEMSGGSQMAIGMTSKYARERVQYDNPIGGYQAIQHFMANMLIAADTCNNYLYRVACMVDEGDDFARDASALKAIANESYRFVTERAVKVHGAIGTTRECDIALFYRRAHPFSMICGSTAYHYEKVAQSLLKEGLGAF